MNNLVKKLGLIMEVGGILTLAGLALKAECERHKTKIQLLDAEILNCCHDINNVLNEAKIRSLEKELEELKSKEKDESQ